MTQTEKLLQEEKHQINRHRHHKPREVFTGDRKNMDHWLLSVEKVVIGSLLPCVPSWMSTSHLTLMTVLWSAGVVLFGYLSAYDIRWLWGFSICIMLQHVTDMLDGAVGRARNTGLIKWGFYADHFLDYVFMCSIVIGYSFLLPYFYLPLVPVHLAICAGFMLHVVLDFAITNDFKISVSRWGVSELRWALIGFNIVLMMTGRKLLTALFPVIILVSTAGLVVMVYRSQEVYRRIDMQNKKEAAGK